MKKKLVVCGGGNSAHTLIPLLKDSIFDTFIYTSKPELWSNQIELEWQNPKGEIEASFSGPLIKASSNLEELFPDADYLVFCMPVHQYRIALHAIAPYISKSKTVFVGTLYGQGGWNWMVDEIRREYNMANLVAFSFGLIPWISRLVEYGHKGLTYGCMTSNYAAVSPRKYFKQIDEEFFEQICYRWFGKGKVEESENFISLTLSVDNQIIHPARCCGLYKKYGRTWKHKEDVPWFYRDFDDTSAELMEGLDNDYSKVRNKIKERFPEKNFAHMLNYLDLEYFSHKYYSKNAKDSILSSQTLHSITTPVIKNSEGTWEIDRNHRFFLDDIFYGNCIVKWMAEQLNVETPTIDYILNWAQEVRGESFIEGGKLLLDSKDLKVPLKSGIPVVYGYSTIDDCID